MQDMEIVEILKEAGAVLTGHFVLTSKNHSAAYINKDAVYPNTSSISRLCRAIAERFTNDQVEVVIAPAIGGVILSQWTAHHLTEMNGHEVFGVYAEKEMIKISETIRLCYHDTGNFVIKRGYDQFITEKRVLVVEDVLSTGGSAKAVVEAVRAIGGNVVGLGALCNRGGVTAKDVADVPKLATLINIRMEAWQPALCPLCKQGIPINTNVGKGAEFLKEQQHC